MTESINLFNWPSYLAIQLGIPEFAAGILASLLVMMLFVMPIMVFHKGRNPLIYVIVGLPLLGFSVALGWFPVWLFVVIVLFIAVGAAKEITKTVGTSS